MKIENSSYLTCAQKDSLGWICEDPDFIDEIDFLVGELVQAKDADNDFNYRKPSDIRREIESLVKKLENISIEVLTHIGDRGQIEAYANLMDVLNRDYYPEKNLKRNTIRDALVSRLCVICRKYEIEPKIYKENAVYEIGGIICTASNLPYDPKEIVRSIVKKNKW